MSDDRGLPPFDPSLEREAGIPLRDGTTTNDRRLDLCRDPGRRNFADFHALELLEELGVRGMGADAARIRRDDLASSAGAKEWEPGPVLDQGREGACVGFAYTADLIGAPRRWQRRDRLNEIEDDARFLYRRAQDLDPWPGTHEGGDEGTSIEAGARAAVEAGHFDAFYWCEDVDQLVAVLLRGRGDGEATFGPAVVGVDWRSGMYECPAEDPVVRPSGPVVGGHAIWIRGVAINPPGFGEPVFTWRNSWGPTYGRGGDALVSAFDLENLLGPQPEICVPVGRRRRSAR